MRYNVFMINDNFLLLSIVNMKLRDNYSDLSSLCEEEGFDEEEVVNRLAEIGYVYNEEENAFKPL